MVKCFWETTIYIVYSTSTQAKRWFFSVASCHPWVWSSPTYKPFSCCFLLAVACCLPLLAACCCLLLPTAAFYCLLHAACYLLAASCFLAAGCLAAGCLLAACWPLAGRWQLVAGWLLAIALAKASRGLAKASQKHFHMCHVTVASCSCCLLRLLLLLLLLLLWMLLLLLMMLLLVASCCWCYWSQPVLTKSWWAWTYVEQAVAMVFHKKHLAFLVLPWKFPAEETKYYDQQKHETWTYVERAVAMVFHKKTLSLLGVTLTASRRGNEGFEPKTAEILTWLNGAWPLGLRWSDVPFFNVMCLS